MKASDFINEINLKGLLVAYFNITLETKNYFELTSNYRKSKFSDLELTENLRQKNNDLLRLWSGINFELNNSTHSFKIIKDEKYNDLETFTSAIYKKIQRHIIEVNDIDLTKYLLISIYGLRGSADFTTGLYAVDIPKIINSKSYYDKLLKLLINIDIGKLNLNFRELQKDYTDNNKKRNTQLRVHLDWFTEKCFSELKNINLYKYDILKNKRLNIRNVNDSFEFVERATYYMANVLTKLNIEEEKILKIRIKECRDELGFKTRENKAITRSQTIVEIAKALYEDECVSCKKIYKKEDRTFKLKGSERYYFELHHVISFASHKQGDQLDNLVKLCPACHKALTPNRAEEIYQKEIIRRILENSKNAYNYVENFFDNPNIEKMIDFVYEKLR
ncbi:MAG: HNH endonuclease [Oceanivirga sp.]|nr:HNH endonuclease [Oceanivirga sp.]